MTDYQRPALSILDLTAFALYGKSKTDDRRGSPSMKASVMGPNLVSFTCYPNSASTVEGEYVNLSLHQVQIHPFLTTVIDAIETMKVGEYILSRNQTKRLPDGQEKKVDGELYVKVSPELVSIGVKNPGKTFVTFGLREIPGYSTDVVSDSAIGDDTKSNIQYALEWFKNYKSVITTTSILLSQGNIRKIGGDNVSPDGAHTPVY